MTCVNSRNRPYTVRPPGPVGDGPAGRRPEATCPEPALAAGAGEGGRRRHPSGQRTAAGVYPHGRA